MVAHKDLTGTDLHEPKGVAGAPVGQVYVSDGAGTGNWKKITPAELDTGTSLPNPNRYFIEVVITDISTTGSVYVPVPHRSNFVSCTSVLGGVIATADSLISFDRNDLASFGTPMTVAFSGSLAGDVDTFTATTNQTINSNGFVKITTDGGSSNTAPLYLTLVFDKVV